MQFIEKNLFTQISSEESATVSGGASSEEPCWFDFSDFGTFFSDTKKGNHDDETDSNSNQEDINGSSIFSMQKLD